MKQKIRSITCDDDLWSEILKAGGSTWLRRIAKEALAAAAGTKIAPSVDEKAKAETARRDALSRFWSTCTRPPKRANTAARTPASSVFERYLGWHRVNVPNQLPYSRPDFYSLLIDLGAVYGYYGVQKRIVNREIIEGKPRPLSDDGL